MLVFVTVVELAVVFVTLSQAEVGHNRCASKELRIPLKVKMFGQGGETCKQIYLPRRAASTTNGRIPQRSGEEVKPWESQHSLAQHIIKESRKHWYPLPLT